MIRLIRINIPNFINNWLPVHRRQVNWLSFLQVLMAPFRIMMDEYISWRDSSITRTYVSSEKLSIEWYLNELFDESLRRIFIDSPDATGLYIALQSEGVPEIFAGLQSEVTELVEYQMVPLPYEDIATGNADFIVNVPLSIAPAEPSVRKTVANYKLAGKRYAIVYF